MADSAKVEGLGEVVARVNAEILAIKNRTVGGMIKAAALVRRETERGEAKVPVDLGNLRASWFVVTPTGVPVGQTPHFWGPRLIRLLKDHATTIQEARSTVKALKETSLSIMMGYTAHYAVFVHEMVGANFQKKKKGRHRRPGATFKWLERAFLKHEHNIKKIIEENVRIKG